MKEDKPKLQLLASILEYVDEYGWDAFENLVGTVRVIIRANEDEKAQDDMRWCGCCEAPDSKHSCHFDEGRCVHRYCDKKLVRSEIIYDKDGREVARSRDGGSKEE